MPAEKKFNLLEDLQKIIFALTEIDQDVVTIQYYYRAGSREKVLKRYEETIGELMRQRDKVKSLTPDSYISS